MTSEYFDSDTRASDATGYSGTGSSPWRADASAINGPDGVIVDIVGGAMLQRLSHKSVAKGSANAFALACTANHHSPMTSPVNDWRMSSTALSANMTVGA